MFTNNYINFLFNRIASVAGAGSIETANGKITSRTMQLVSGDLATVYDSGYDIGNCMGYARCQEITTSSMDYSDGYNYYKGLYFGSGATPASREDYTLEEPITTGLSFSGGWDKIVMENGKFEAVARYIVFNTSQEEITIREIGCFNMAKNSASTSTTAKSYALVMIERTVLPEPITIAAGESKTVTYKVTFDYSL